MTATRNLVLVSEQRHMDPADFEAVATCIREHCDDIEVFVVENGSLNSRVARVAERRPSIVVCPTPLDMFRPRRGRVFAGQFIGKMEEMRRMQDAGLPVPRWTPIAADTRLDPRDWGSPVVVKPGFGGQNLDIALLPPEAVTYRDPATLPESHRGRLGPMIAQRFIDTGSAAGDFRVLTLFGRPLYAIRQVAALRPPGHVDRAGDGPGGRVELVYESDVLALAARVHATMPDVATVACDIVRETGSGDLYLLEANCRGFSWHLSSPQGKAQQAHNRLDFYA